jgi:putative hydrolase of the HAD superfamily
MKFEAVIFDLFGTLVPSVDEGAYVESIRRTARAAAAEPEAFRRAWQDPEVSRGRAIGVFPTQAACVRHCCRRIGLEPDDAAVAGAATVRADYERSLLIPRPDAVDALERIRGRELRLGLMSACSRDTPRVWPDTPFPPLFDDAVFSCEAGVTKPDGRLYRLGCDRLRAAPERCLYVGDGALRELTGARQAGLRPVLICPPEEAEVIRAHEDARAWEGPTVAALGEVLALLD